MKLALYLFMAFWATLSAVAIVHLAAEEIRFDSREAGKPWQQHPIVRLCIFYLAGILFPLALGWLLSALLTRFGAPPASRLGWTLGWKTGAFVIFLGMLLKVGPLDTSQRYLTAEIMLRLSKPVAVEQFFQRHWHAWWLPRALFALVFSALFPSGAMWCATIIAFRTYNSMQLRFQKPHFSPPGC
jgi:hypothetical protein